MKVVILCGGLGTRLKEETEYRPKPLVDVGGRPILWHIMKTYAHYGHTEFILCLGYRGTMIKEYFLNYEAMSNDFTLRLGDQSDITYHDVHSEQGFNVTLAETGLESMTGARVSRVERYIDGDTFMASYGDGVADVDVGGLLEFHKSHGKIATVTSIHPTSRFGVLEVDDSGLVTRFVEKPTVDGWVSAGYFVFDRRIFSYLNDDPSLVLEQQPLQSLANEGELMCYRHSGFFFAMDTYREYLHLNELWDGGVAPWAVWDPTQAGEQNA